MIEIALKASDLLVKTPAKINLHLEILGFREDGFHELAMVMQSIDLFDTILFSKNNNNIIELKSNNEDLTLGDDNLIIKAANLLREYSGDYSLGAKINLNKNIPIGAGLAGGSTNAAGTLLGLNTFWGLNYSDSILIKLSEKLGSDVPFCINGGTQLCFGRGEKLEKVDKSENDMALILVKNPSSNVSTPWAYKMYRENYDNKYFLGENEFEIRRKVLREEKWLKPLNSKTPPPLINNLQKVVAPVESSVQRSLSLLSALPNVLSFSMSGSGPSCFALFQNLENANEVLRANKHKFDAEGLDSWCCSLIPKGVYIEQ